MIREGFQTKAECYVSSFHTSLTFAVTYGVISQFRHNILPESWQYRSLEQEEAQKVEHVSRFFASSSTLDLTVAYAHSLGYLRVHVTGQPTLRQFYVMQKRALLFFALPASGPKKAVICRSFDSSQCCREVTHAVIRALTNVYGS